MDIARKSIERECDIYLRFDKKIKKLFGPNARVIKKKSDPRHIPGGAACWKANRKYGEECEFYGGEYFASTSVS